MLFRSDEDPLVPLANAQLLARHIPNARLEVVERGGHLLLMDDAENLGARIRRFLSGVEEKVSASASISLS